jgi:hypothetical protein
MPANLLVRFARSRGRLESNSTVAMDSITKLLNLGKGRVGVLGLREVSKQTSRWQPTTEPTLQIQERNNRKGEVELESGMAGFPPPLHT